jgi:hypothetical protein
VVADSLVTAAKDVAENLTAEIMMINANKSTLPDLELWLFDADNGKPAA